MDDLTLTQLISRLDDRWHAVLQRLDRTDATHAGISRTLCAMGMTLEHHKEVLEQQTMVFERLWTMLEYHGQHLEQQGKVLERQTQVLERLLSTLDRWLDQHRNGEAP